jgi:ATP/ADP translocase
VSEPPVYNVTNARVPLSADQSGRYRKYIISMSIRIACFVACILSSGWWRWGFFIGALILPWVAVVIANAGRENASGAADSMQHSPWELE